MTNSKEIRMDKNKKTIDDFTDQWEKFPGGNDGFFTSPDLLRDTIFPLIQLEDIEGKKVVDIGSGTGRIVNMLLDAGAKHVIAVEPSEGFNSLKNNTHSRANQIEYLQIKGEELPAFGDIDFAFSIGVLQFIPNPVPCIKAIHKSLKPGGKFIAWVYSKEGSEAYLLFLKPIRAVTKHLPHPILMGLVFMVELFIFLYMQLCRVFPLPLKAYLFNVYKRVSSKARRMTIYDQLNPSHVKYFSRDEVLNFMKASGFEENLIHHRYGYSWTVVGTKTSD
jgi:SAM-dependent methyltransferase